MAHELGEQVELLAAELELAVGADDAARGQVDLEILDPDRRGGRGGRGGLWVLLVRCGEAEADAAHRVDEARVGGVVAELIRNAGRVVTREDLMSRVWDENWFGSTKTLDVHMGWLRRKLGDDAAAPRFLHTVRGVGFRFAPADGAAP